MNANRNQRLSQLDQDLLALSRQLTCRKHRQLIRAFVCGAVAQSAEQRALVPPTVVRIHAAQLRRDPARPLTPM
jgi:hypothetical protein